MDILAVGVTVYQEGNAVLFGRFGGKGGIDIHNLGGFFTFALFTDVADFLGDFDADKQRQHQKQRLPPFLVDFAAELLIADIVNTQCVAVAEQRFAAE